MIKIILCAFNEAQNLQTLLPNIDNCVKKITDNYQVIICIDGSFDNSLQLILNLQKIYPIKLITPQNQRGLGLAYKRIFLDVIKNCEDQDLIISLDADNTHNPLQINDLVQFCKSNNLDVVIASRFCKNSVVKGFPLHRKFISKATSIVLKTLFPITKKSGKTLQDYSSGYRIYKASKLKELFKIYGENFILEEDFTYTCEILLKIAKTRANIDEFPLIYSYNNKLGASKLKILKNFKNLLRLIFNNL